MNGRIGIFFLATWWFSLLTTGQPPRQKQVELFDLQGHRGCRALKPENTLPAFEKALDLQVTTLELDLHLSGDGHVVVWHDPQIGPHCRREQNSKDENRFWLSRMTLAEIKQFTCDQNPDPERFPRQSAEPMPLTGDNFSIPTLAEVFRMVSNYARSPLKTARQRHHAERVHFNIETKRVSDQPQFIGDEFDGEKAGLFEREVVALVESFGLLERVTVQSFDHRSIRAVSRLQPRLQTVALTVAAVNPKKIAKTTGAAVWSPHFESVTRKRIRRAHRAGMLVIPWTVNQPEPMKRLIDLGVDGIITDAPDTLAAILRQRGIPW